MLIAWLVVFDTLDLGPKAKPGVVHHYKSVGIFIVCVHINDCSKSCTEETLQGCTAFTNPSTSRAIQHYYPVKLTLTSFFCYLSGLNSCGYS